MKVLTDVIMDNYFEFQDRTTISLDDYVDNATERIKEIAGNEKSVKARIDDFMKVIENGTNDYNQYRRVFYELFTKTEIIPQYQPESISRAILATVPHIRDANHYIMEKMSEVLYKLTCLVKGHSQ